MISKTDIKIDCRTQVTIIIPTYNRIAYLLRLLKYYSESMFLFNVFVIDSSIEQPDVMSKQAIEESGCSYQWCSSDIGPYQKIALGLASTTTPYVVVNADDDFVIPESIVTATRFLDMHSDYSVALGLHAKHALYINKGKKFRFDWEPLYAFGESIEDDAPVLRLQKHITNYRIPTFYGVHRTEQFRQIWTTTLFATNHARMGEVCSTALTLIQGKMKYLSLLYALREKSVGTEHSCSRVLDYCVSLEDVFVEKMNENGEFDKIVSCLSNALQIASTISNVDADLLCKNLIENYLKTRTVLKKVDGVATQRKIFLHKLMRFFRVFWHFRRQWRSARIYRAYYFAKCKDPLFRKKIVTIRRLVINAKAYPISE